MNRFRSVSVCLASVAFLAGCRRSSPGEELRRWLAAGPPPSSEWHLRLVIDSAGWFYRPTERVAEGRVDWRDHSLAIDLRALLGDTIPRRFTLAWAAADAMPFEMVIGDRGADHDGRLILQGAQSGDSVAGTWSQQAYCCAPSGHFVLWRVNRR